MRCEEIVKQWRNESGGSYYFKHAIVVTYDAFNLYIITDRPGLMIGYHGQIIDKYKKILEENGYDQQITFVDTLVGDVKKF